MVRTLLFPRLREWSLVLIPIAAMLLGPGELDSRWADTLANSMHGVVFFVVAFALFSLSDRLYPPVRKSILLKVSVVLGACAVLGVLVELLQHAIGRDAEIEDVLNDLLGASIGSTARICVQIAKRKAIWVAAVGGALPALVLCWPIAQCLHAYVGRDLAFPVLLQAGNPSLSYFVASRSAELSQVPLPDEWSHSQDDRAMRVRFKNDSWVGVGVFEPQPNWSGYSQLLFELANPNDQRLPLQIRVFDDAFDGSFEDQFNRTFDVPPRMRVVLKFPLAEVRDGPSGRPMQMDAISDLLLYSRGEQVADRELYICRVWLE